MSNFTKLPIDVQKEIGGWDIIPKLENPLDRTQITFNGNDRDGYILFPEWMLGIKGLTCLEFHIFSRLFPDGNTIDDVLMLDIPILICGPNGPTEEQLNASIPEITVLSEAPIEYLDQPKVIEAILNLEKKGLIAIKRNNGNESN